MSREVESMSKEERLQYLVDYEVISEEIEKLIYRGYLDLDDYLYSKYALDSEQVIEELEEAYK